MVVLGASIELRPQALKAFTTCDQRKHHTGTPAATPPGAVMINPMQIGMVGLGRMGANMVRRIGRAGHSSVVYDQNSQAVAALVSESSSNSEVIGAHSLADLVSKLEQPRALLPAAVVDGMIEQLLPVLAPSDTMIDGGNSFYLAVARRQQNRRARAGTERRALCPL
jgi:6-phosphogluconate dehydrogenase